MISEIKHLISSGNYDKALHLISEELKNEPDLTDPRQEQAYKELIGLRVAANSLRGNSDDLILDAVRQKRFVVPKAFLVDQKHPIVLNYNNLFDTPTDAYVTTIHAEKKFDVEANAATQRLLELIGKSEIQKQLKTQSAKTIGDYYLLSHTKLKSQFSYHILCYEGDKGINLPALTCGLRNVLEDGRQRRFKRMAFSALGLGVLRKLPEHERPALAETIANKIAETVVEFLWEHTNEKALPEINFAFVDPRTAQLFENVFYHHTKLDHHYYERQRILTERERILIERIGTANIEYTNILKSVNNFIDEDSVILIGGETGVGKSMLAQTIHSLSTRSKGPFVQLNCAAISPELVYSTLFGSEKGSFTDAKNTTRGYVEEAQDGTLFLDEIGEADFEVQQSLMTFLDHGKYRRLRGQTELQSNAKIIFGTNKNLVGMVKQKKFKHDLYERLEQRIIHIPALRKRPEDIEVLIDSMMNKWNGGQDRKIAIDKQTINHLAQYNWPGNVRQLSHYLEMRFHDAVYDKSFRITKTKIENNPPRNQLHQSESSSLGILEGIISDLLKNSESSHGVPVKTILEAIASKVYLEDLRYPVTKASDILGIDGSGGTNSTLKQRVKLYKEIQARLGQSE